jgi:hypothetical protein
MMSGSVLQEDIVSTVGVLVRKGRDILGINPGSEMTCPKDENQTTSLSATTANCAASVQRSLRPQTDEWAAVEV